LAALLLAAQILFTLLAVTLGGVSLEQVFQGYAVLGATLFFLCNLALLCSVLCRSTLRAGIWTGVLAASFRRPADHLRHHDAPSNPAGISSLVGRPRARPTREQAPACRPANSGKSVPPSPSAAARIRATRDSSAHSPRAARSRR
jgi:hypothetical protein